MAGRRQSLRYRLVLASTPEHGVLKGRLSRRNGREGQIGRRLRSYMVVNRALRSAKEGAMQEANIDLHRPGRACKILVSRQYR